MSWFSAYFFDGVTSKCRLVEKEMCLMETSMGELLSFYLCVKLNVNPWK